VSEWNVFQYDYWVFGRIVFQQGLEVRAASGQHHLMCLARLAITSERNISKAPFCSKMFEASDDI